MPDRTPNTGSAGASAHARSERLRQRRRQEAAARGQTARFLRALAGPSAYERRLMAEEHSWATGGRGEQKLAQALASRCPGVPLLHDRRIPQSRANIDHLAFAASGIYVIDTKRYRGRIAVETPLFGSPRLRIAGRDRRRLVTGLGRQVAIVQGILDELGEDVPLHGCLCFVAPEGLLADVELPLLRTLRINGYPLYYTRRLARQLRSEGPIDMRRARLLQAALAARLPPAT